MSTNEELFQKLPRISADDNILLLTHNDLDGAGPAILLRTVYEKVNVQHCSNGEMSGIIRDSVLDPGSYDAIVICDISCDQQAAKEIDDTLKASRLKVVLLDHHPTAMHLNAYSWAAVSPHAPTDTVRGKHYKNIRDYSPLASGTALLFDYLAYTDSFISTGMKECVIRNMLSLTQLISAYDTWEWNDIFKDDMPKKLNSLFGIYGAARFEERMTKKMYSNDGMGLISAHELDLLNIEQDRVNEIVMDVAKRIREEELRIDGKDYRCVTCFTDDHISDIFLYMKQQYPDADLYIINYGYGVSIRSIKPDIDVSAITARHGGGGHPGAGGFRIPESTQRKFMLSAFDDTQI